MPKLWNIHQLYVLQVLIEEGEKRSKKSGKCSNLCRDIVFVCCDTISSIPKELCRSQQLNVATKLKQNSRLKEQFCRDKEFFCCDIIEEDCEENYRDSP